jgi:hypothetical protein
MIKRNMQTAYMYTDVSIWYLIIYMHMYKLYSTIHYIYLYHVEMSEDYGSSLCQSTLFGTMRSELLQDKESFQD